MGYVGGRGRILRWIPHVQLSLIRHKDGCLPLRSSEKKNRRFSFRRVFINIVAESEAESLLLCIRFFLPGYNLFPFPLLPT